MDNVILFFSSLFLCLIVKLSSQPVSLQHESQELYVSKIFRVKRQAGYVYDRPSVSFELPTRAPTVSTQAPTVDRTQAQMMYYAYPAPAAPAGGDTVTIGGTVGATSGSSATASSGITTGGYNYGPQNVASSGAQSLSGTGSSQTSTGSVQSSSSLSGYGYNAPTEGTGSLSNTYPTSSIGSTQTINSGSSQSASSTGSSESTSNSGPSGYSYNVPRESQSGSRQGPLVVSTNAPTYLPPNAGGGSSNGNVIGSARVETNGAVSTGSSMATPPLDQYLPPATQLNTPLTLPSSNPTVNVGIQPSLGSGVNSNYIPPGGAAPPSSPTVNVGIQSSLGSGISSSYRPPGGASPSSTVNATPRPFSPSPPPTGYLPPNVGFGTRSQNSPSTPAPTYLPPVK